MDNLQIYAWEYAWEIRKIHQNPWENPWLPRILYPRIQGSEKCIHGSILTDTDTNGYGYIHILAIAYQQGHPTTKHTLG
jgi:hypothetical protein